MDKMDTFFKFTLTFTLLAVTLPVHARSSVRHRTPDDAPTPCPEQFFLHHGTHECTPCSECPVDEIIRFPCTYHQDTVCGPFYEFEFFNINGPNRNSKKDVEVVEEEKIEDGEDDVHRSPGIMTVSGEEQTWRHLCYGLMGALLLLFLAALVYVILLTIHRRSRLHHLSGKTITVADPSDPTVYYQAQIITAAPITSPTTVATSATTSPYAIPDSRDASIRSLRSSNSSLGRFSLLEGHLRRMLSGGGRAGNVYVDPTGRVYTRKDNGERVDEEEEDTHPFIRVDAGVPLVHGPIYTGSSRGPTSHV